MFQEAASKCGIMCNVGPKCTRFRATESILKITIRIRVHTIKIEGSNGSKIPQDSQVWTKISWLKRFLGPINFGFQEGHLISRVLKHFIVV